MKKSFFYCTFVFIAVVFVSNVFAAELVLPQPDGFVNDYANVLTTEEKISLENELAAFEKETSSEIAVVTVADLADTTIEDYSAKLFANWGIGKQGKDNGILFLIAPGERKVRVEVGYGLEGVLPDGKVGAILDAETIPFFKEGNFAEGIIRGTRALILATREEYTAKEASFGEGAATGAANIVIFLFPLIIAYIGSFLGRSKRIWPGGALGFVVGGGIALAVVGVLASALIFAFALGIIGLVFDWIVSSNYAARKRKGLPTSWWSSGGGFSGGGGFGGFGGGGFGGGGAGRGW